MQQCRRWKDVNVEMVGSHLTTGVPNTFYSSTLLQNERNGAYALILADHLYPSIWFLFTDRGTNRSTDQLLNPGPNHQGSLAGAQRSTFGVSST